jgi:hypothetical protein
MKKSFIILAASISVATLGACDTDAKYVQKVELSGVRANAETQADAIEGRADTLDSPDDVAATAVESQMEDKAEMVREKDDAKADAMKYNPD